MAAKARVDWDAVEPHYRAGVMSLREIGLKFDCTSGRVAQVAKEKVWHRDLSGKIKAEANAKLSRSILSDSLRAKKALSEKDVVEANSELVANVLIVERKDIARNRALATKLLEELEGITGSQELLAAVGEMMAQPEEARGSDKLNELYHKVIALPSRIKSMKELADTLKTLIGLERQAFSLDDADKHSDKCMVVIPD